MTDQKEPTKENDLSRVLTGAIDYATSGHRWANGDDAKYANGGFVPAENRHGEYVLALLGQDGVSHRGILRLQTHYVYGQGRVMIQPLDDRGQKIGDSHVYLITARALEQNSFESTTKAVRHWISDVVIRALRQRGVI